MPEHLRAFVVILTLSGITFFAIRKPALSMGIAPEDFARRRNVWLLATAIAFLAHSFWVFTILMIPVLLYARRREPNPFALYLFVLFAVPPFGAALSGLGIVNQLFELSYPRLLSLLILLPWALQRRYPGVPAFGKRLVDWLVVGYVLLQLYQQWQIDTSTNTLRYGFYAVLDILLPFYVASRSVRTHADFRDVLLSLLCAAALMAPIAVFEFWKHWLLYSGLPAALGMEWSGGNYLGRGNTLRAVVTTGHSIALGYVMMIAILLHLALRQTTIQPRIWASGMAMLVIGSIASVSRGPWVGLLAGALAFVATGHQPLKNLSKFVGLAVLAVPVLFATGGIEYLPFVGKVDNVNVEFRQRLFELSMLVISQNPWFGSPTFMLAEPLQELRSGGLIDIVNSYLLVALQVGYVGLAMFVGAFVRTGVGIIIALRHQADRDSESYLQGRALLAAQGAILVAIASASPIGFVPLMYWCVAGLALGYAETVRQSRPVDEVAESRYAMRTS